MANMTNNNITITPSRMSSRATILRADVNQVLGFARCGDVAEMENSIVRMRMNLRRFENDARRYCDGGQDE